MLMLMLLLMINDACAHAMSRLNACLTPRVLQPFPPKRNLILRLHNLPFPVVTRINRTKIVLTFPCSVLLIMIIPNHLVELNDCYESLFPFLQAIELVFLHRSNPTES